MQNLVRLGLKAVQDSSSVPHDSSAERFRQISAEQDWTRLWRWVQWETIDLYAILEPCDAGLSNDAGGIAFTVHFVQSRVAQGHSPARAEAPGRQAAVEYHSVIEHRQSRLEHWTSLGSPSLNTWWPPGSQGNAWVMNGFRHV